MESPAGNIEILPSGYVKIALENGHRNSEISHLKKNSDFP